jgi:hypothetical protein
MKKLFLTAFMAGGFFLGAVAQDSTAIRYAGSISASDMERHLSILASDSLEGRETGTRGQKMAADYIKNHFQQIGLQAPANSHSHYQRFELEERSWGPIYLKSKKQQYDNFEDVIYYGNAHLPQETELEAVFVGRGRPFDYEGLDVEGKAVVIFDAEDKGWRKKLQTAREKGAAAYIVTSGADQGEFRRTVNNARLFVDRPKLGFKSENNGDNSSIFFFVAPETAAEIMNTKLSKLDRAIEKANAGKEKAIRRIKTSSVAVKTERKIKSIETENVLGFMEGTDLKDEVLIITSHYDHIGMTDDGEVFNGADDDGSGTTTVLEIAEAFAQAKEAGQGPRRSILFMTVTGEEKGLLGSEYYVKNPLYPLVQTVTNLNIDMVGRSDKMNKGKEDYIYIIGSDKLSTELHQLSENVNKTYAGLNLDYSYNDENDPNRYYYRSDHYNFAKNNIPVIFYFNGTHDDYHKTTDTIEKIDFRQMEKRGRLVFHTAWELANRDKRVSLDQQLK